MESRMHLGCRDKSVFVSHRRREGQEKNPRKLLNIHLILFLYSIIMRTT
ncbi:hypothetical protein GK0789 [Geobacillus kaustophilus HTA426]|uniref:Uncharacterized protein n=1 Tax=Geobacillus kaustophilus (strain HTA426) TaxID=235909 RepID=Q5L1V6_GEOKA|nr:hypothetical protein GK0789 [Geobacillus kaustophilus HTA426]